MKNGLFYTALAVVMLIGGCSQQTVLFNGENLDGWTVHSEKTATAPETVWIVKDGILHCKGTPTGYIRTLKEYSDYKLYLEWRWVEKPGNSGVLLHTQGEDKIFPLCIEAQLKHKNAGDFVTIQPGSSIRVGQTVYAPPEDAFYKIIEKQYKSTENLPGQWNKYEIVCKKGTIELTVNGVLQNVGTEASLTSGAICLQSEGAPIEFRNIYIAPLDLF